MPRTVPGRPPESVARKLSSEETTTAKSRPDTPAPRAATEARSLPRHAPYGARAPTGERSQEAIERGHDDRKDQAENQQDSEGREAGGEEGNRPGPHGGRSGDRGGRREETP